MLLMTLGLAFFFVGVFKNDKRFFKAILGCLVFDIVFWIIYFVQFYFFPIILLKLS